MSAHDEANGPGPTDPYHHLHDEAYDRPFAAGRVGWRGSIPFGPSMAAGALLGLAL